MFLTGCGGGACVISCQHCGRVKVLRRECREGGHVVEALEDEVLAKKLRREGERVAGGTALAVVFVTVDLWGVCTVSYQKPARGAHNNALENRLL